MCNSVELLQNQYRRGPQDWDSQVQLLNIHKEELHWWATQAQLWNSRDLKPTSSIEDPNRCLVNRLGCSVQQQQDWGTLDSPRVHLSHQLLGASSSFSGYKDLCKGSGRYSDRPSNGQHVSVNIHQQERRHPVPIADNSGKRMLDVVYGQKDNTHSTALTRETKRYCRRGIPDNQGSLGLDAESNHFRSDTVSSGADGHRSVCIKDNSPTPSLEARNLLSIKENK